MPDAPLDDSEALEKLNAGDPDAWDQLIRDHERLVYSIPRRMGMKEQDCEEVSQMTWLSLRSRIHLLRSPAAIAGWLRVTAQRTCWKLIQSNRHKTLLTEEAESIGSPDQDLTEDLIRMEAREQVRKSMDELSPRCKALLTKLYWDPTEPSYEEIGQELDMPVGSVGPTRLRCMEKLARLFEAKRSMD